MVDKNYKKSYEMWYKLSDDPQLTTYYLRHTTLLETKMRNGKTYKIVWAITSLDRFLKGFLKCKNSSNFDEEWWSDAIYNLCWKIGSLRMFHVKWSLDMDEMLANIKKEASRIERDDLELKDDYKPKIKSFKITVDMIGFINMLKKFCFKLRDEGH